MNAKMKTLLAETRAKNPRNGEVVVEVRGKQAKTYCYKRNGEIGNINVDNPKSLGWPDTARNPKLVLFRGECIVVRLGDDKSYLVSADGVEELPSEEHWRNDKQ